MAGPASSGPSAFGPISGPNGPAPISDSMDGRFRYRGLKVHAMPMDHLIPRLVFDRYIGEWSCPDIGSDKWSKLSLWLHSNGLPLFGPFGPWCEWSKWPWFVSSCWTDIGFIGPAPIPTSVFRSVAFGPSCHYGPGPLNAHLFRYWMDHHGRPASMRCPDIGFHTGTHMILCVVSGSVATLIFVAISSSLVDRDADLRDAVPLLQHVQSPGVAKRCLELAQKEVGHHGVAPDMLDGDAQFGSARLFSVDRFVGLQLLARGPAPLVPRLLGLPAGLLPVPFGAGLDGCLWSNKRVQRHHQI